MNTRPLLPLVIAVALLTATLVTAALSGVRVL
jgi:hypothetical protein